MVTEIATITIRPGSEAAFAVVMEQQGLPILRGIPGTGTVQFGRGVENPDTFVILVEWDDMAAHAAFREMPVYAEFGKLFAGHSIGGAMEHFALV